MSSNPISDQLPRGQLIPLKQPPSNEASSLRANPAFPDGDDVAGGKDIVFGVSSNLFSQR